VRRGAGSGSEGQIKEEEETEELDEPAEPETFSLMSEEECLGSSARPNQRRLDIHDTCDTEPDEDSDTTEGEGEQQRTARKPPAFTRQWRAGFLKRVRLSLRHPHMRRRPTVDPDHDEVFLRQMPEVFVRFAV
jgi:hypothetical protein